MRFTMAETMEDRKSRRPCAISRARLDVTAGKLFEYEIPHSRGFPKRMRGDYRYPGNSVDFRWFACEFYKRLGLGVKLWPRT